MKAIKPLGHKAYGSIPHLPGSRRGPGDHGISESQASICTVQARDKHDRVIVQEKLDGSCCSVARINGEIVPLVRAGYPAKSSPYEMHHWFHDWAMARQVYFRDKLKDGERVVGEWLAQAHGTLYTLPHGPFVVFDLMRGHDRVTWDELFHRMNESVFPMLLATWPVSIEKAMLLLSSGHGALDPLEGCVWRVERFGKVDFLAKYVRPDKVDGCYLPEQSGQPPVFNWKPRSTPT